MHVVRRRLGHGACAVGRADSGGYLIVAGADGRAHYVDLGNRVDLSRYPRGAQVIVRQMPRAPHRVLAMIQRTPQLGR